MSIPLSYRAPWDLDQVLADSPFLADLGIRFLHLAEDGVCFELEQSTRHLNAEGRMHGGVIASLLDAACGLPVRVVGNDCDLVRAVTLTLSVDYLRAPRGPIVRAEGRIVGGGRKIVFSRGEVLDADGTVVALASGSFKRLLPAQPDQTLEEKQ